jgi:hypothetical protein
VASFVGEPRRRDDSSLHPLINPARLLDATFQDDSFRQHQNRLYQPRHDFQPPLLPFNCGILTLKQAQDLYTTYFSNNSSSLITYFDPSIHNFDYVTQHSALLLTCILWRAAASLHQYSDIREELFKHMEKTLIPSIFSRNHRSVEIVQALILLSAYYPPSGDTTEDRSWTLLGWAIRLATDLKIHSTITSTSLLPVTYEKEYRQRRNSER